jgi:hypothetical protein
MPAKNDTYFWHLKPGEKDYKRSYSGAYAVPTGKLGNPVCEVFAIFQHSGQEEQIRFWHDVIEPSTQSMSEMQRIDHPIVQRRRPYHCLIDARIR